jgi:YidC/Oxa1 family membrane protein insertase
MDKNTLIGLGLIGAILVTFSLFNQPSAEEIKRQQEEKAKLEEQRKKEIQNESETLNFDESLLPSGWAAKRDSLNRFIVNEDGSFAIYDAERAIDSSFIPVETKKAVKETATKSKAISQEKQTFASLYMHTEGEKFVLENNLIKTEISEKGGQISSVFLKKYRTYTDFASNNEDAYLQLFDQENSVSELIFKYQGEKIRTRNLYFNAIEQTANSITMRLSPEEGKYIDFIYSLAPDSYHLDVSYDIYGFQDEIDPDQILMNWRVDLLRTEKAASQERMVSTVFFENEKGYDYLSETKSDNLVTELPSQWIAFKQSYFTSILIPEKPIQTGAKLGVQTFDKTSPKEEKYIKNYSTTFNLGMNSSKNGSVQFKWYFGPNDYHILASYDQNLEDIVNLGWGIFRWVNIYGIQPIFVWLINIGIGAGIAILILTIIVKLILTPVTWKMYVSSAKMRILRPQIDQLNEKFPKKEDAMKKQMEMMALYKESGASPLSGCLPMLLQMPILFAVFRFFPSSFALRQKGFLWAEDLSSYDAIVSWETYVPFLSDIYGNHISLFTLLMAATTLVYTHFNSSQMQQPTQPGMPNMKVIMYFFPIMMIFFFNNYSSGLSYYYFISTLTSILIMLAIKQFFVDEDKLKAKMEAKQAAKGSGEKKKKSKFQERLEAMQQAQKDKMNKR